jgi:hypothetical protein
MIRTDAEYKNAQEKLDQEQETLQWQREQLEPTLDTPSAGGTDLFLRVKVRK